MLKPAHILILFALLLGGKLCAQTLPLMQYTTENGLPSNNVYDIYRDRQGYLWFGTDKGAVRYNGSMFQKFTTTDGLSDNEIFRFSEDQEGRLWMNTYNGRLCFYHNGRFYNENNTPWLKTGFTSHSSFIRLQPDSSVTVSYAYATRFIHMKKGYARKYDISGLIEATRFAGFDVTVTDDHQFLISLVDKQMLMDTQGKVLRILPYTVSKQPFSLVVQCQKNTPAFVNSDGIYDANRTQLAPFSFPSKLAVNPGTYDHEILKIFFDGGRVFLCTRQGLFINNGIHLFPQTIITGMTADINGNYWISTYRSGVYFVSRELEKIVRYEHAYRQSIASPIVSDNRFFFTSQFDYPIRTFFDKKITSLQQVAAQPGKKPEPIGAFTIVNDTIYARGEGCYYRMDINGRSLSPVVAKGNAYSQLMVNSRYVYGINIFGVEMVSLDSLRQKREVTIRSVVDINSRQKRIVTRSMDKYGHVWFCTNDSVYRIVDTSLMVERRLNNTVFRKMLFCGNYLLAYDSKDTFFIYRNNPDGLKLIKKKYDRSVVWGDIFRISDNKVIVSTNSYYQLISLSDRTGRCTFSPLEDPFIPANALFIYADTATCYFVHNEQITSFPLSYIYRTPSKPVVYFTSLHTQDSVYNIQDEITLSANQSKSISIGFAGVSFSSREMSFQYSITDNPADTNWIDISGYDINLNAPGSNTYYVRLRAKGLSTAYSELVGFKLTVRPPFWLRRWVIVVELLLGLVLIVFITRAIVVSILARRRRMYDLESRYHAAEYKTLNALMNPHFIFNSLNNIKGLMNRDEKKAANKFLNSFSSLVRQNMQNIAKEHITLREELELVAKYLELEKIRFGDLVDYRIEVEPGIDVEDIFIAPLLIQPLAENAVKHGLMPKQAANGLITIRVYARAQSVFVEVTDNGVGIGSRTGSEHEGFDSLGLQNIEKRIAYMRLSGKQQIFFSIRPIVANGIVGGTVATIEIIQ